MHEIARGSRLRARHLGAPRRITRTLATLAVILLLTVGGCPMRAMRDTSQWDTAVTPAEATTAVATAIVKTLPSTSIKSHLDDEVETEWFAIAGRTAGILWWRKTWQARVRYTASAEPAGSSVSGSRVTLHVEVEERPNSKWEWQAGDPDLAEKHSVELRRAIYGALR